MGERERKGESEGGQEREGGRAGERERGREGAGEREEKFSSSFPLSARMPACRRGGRKMGKRGAS